MAIDTNTPTFVERDPAVIMAESKAKLEELLGRELQPAQGAPSASPLLRAMAPS
mgnify:CR=1 FL=1